MEDASRSFARRMQRVADQPRTSVLEYAYGVPEREADAVQAVKLAEAALAARRQLDEPDDDAARARLLRDDGLLAQFSRTHPQTFLQMTASGGSALRALEALKGLARFRQQMHHEGIGEAEAMVEVTKYLMAYSTSSAPASSSESVRGADEMRGESSGEGELSSLTPEQPASAQTSHRAASASVQRSPS